MTLEELRPVLDASGIPFAYHHWETTMKPPYGVYLAVYATPFYADGEVYYQGERMQVELYTAHKDPASEARVEAALRGAGIVFEKSETHVEREKLFEILYEIEV